MKRLDVNKLINSLTENNNFKRTREESTVVYQFKDRTGELKFLPIKSTLWIEVYEVYNLMAGEICTLSISEKEFTNYAQISQVIFDFIKTKVPLVIKHSDIISQIDLKERFSGSFKDIFNGFGALWISNMGVLRPDGKSRFISALSMSNAVLGSAHLNKSIEDLNIAILIDLITGDITVGTILSAKSIKGYISSGYPIVDETEPLINITDDIDDKLLYSISNEFFNKINKYYLQFIWTHLYKDTVRNPIFFKPLRHLAKIEETMSIKGQKGGVYKIIVPSDKREGTLVINYTEGISRFRILDRPTNYIIRSTSRKDINRFFSDTIINVTNEVSDIMSRAEEIRRRLSNRYSRVIVELLERDTVTSEINVKIIALFMFGWDINIGITVEIKQNDPTVRCSLEFKGREYKNLIYTNNAELISPIMITEDISADMYDRIASAIQ